MRTASGVGRKSRSRTCTITDVMDAAARMAMTISQEKPGVLPAGIVAARTMPASMIARSTHIRVR